MEQERKPVSIDDPVQLLVEGKDPRNFFEKFIAYLNLAEIQLQNFGGVNDLKGFLEGFVLAPGFARVRSIGIVRDAERRVGEGALPEAQPSPAMSAFQSVQSSLRNVGLPVPNRPTQETGTAPAVNVFILPGDGGDGMLETLLCRTIAGTAVDRCIDSFFRCAGESGNPIHRPDKARARAYLATTPDPHLSVGVAAKRNRWNLDHDAFDGVRRFLMSLAQDRPAA